MSLSETDPLSEQGQAVLRRAGEELAELAQRPLLPEDFFAEYLKRTVGALNALGGAVWLRNEQGAHLYAKENFSTSGYHSGETQKKNIDRVLGAVFREKTAYILAARAEDGFATPDSDGVENETAYPFFFAPVLVEGRVLGVVCLWLRQAGEPKVYPDYLRFILSTTAQAAAFLNNLQGNSVALRLSQSGSMVRCLQDLVGEVDERAIAIHAVNHLAEFFRASRCSLFRRDGRGRWRLEMASNQEAIDHRSQLVQKLCSLAAVLGNEPTLRVLDREGADEQTEAALAALGDSHAGSVFFSRRPGTKADGLLLIERFSASGFSPETPHHLEWAGKQLERAFHGAAACRDSSLPVLGPLVRVSRRLVRARSGRLAAAVGIPLLLGVVLAVVPWPLRLKGECAVLPERMSIVTSEADGPLTSVLVREGERVEAGQVLATIDDRDLATQLAVARHEVLRWESSAYSSQSSRREADRSIAQINLARAQVAIERLDFLKGKTEIRSPISGVVLTRGLGNREGETIRVGQQFCEIAAQDAYEVEVLVKQQDVGLLLSELDEGRPVEVDFILHAFPHLRLSTELTAASQVSSEAQMKDGVSYFVARARFPVESDLQDLLKPGYSGLAKINLPERPVGAVLFRRFADFVRVRWSL